MRCGCDDSVVADFSYLCRIMGLLKNILKFLLMLFVGMVFGLLVAAVAIVVFTDMSFGDFFAKLSSVDLSSAMLAIVAGIMFFALSFVLLIIIHEAGHLVCGLASGYRFVSFRIFSYTIIRSGRRLRVRRFAVAGTGGQCLLTPPDRDIEEVPVTLYNSGGLIAQLVAAAAVLPILMMNDSFMLLHEFAVIFLMTDTLLFLINGVPMTMGGVGNDAYNLLQFRRSILSRRSFVLQLRSNALLQEGIRPREMPAAWFEMPDNTDMGNPHEVAILLMAASRLLDEGDFEGAYDAFKCIYEHKDKIISLYVKEIACELAFTAMMTGRLDEAGALLDDAMMKYVGTYRRYMSSKERLVCAVELFMHHDRASAGHVYESLYARRDQYLLRGEVESDLALMRSMLGK